MDSGGQGLQVEIKFIIKGKKKAGILHEPSVDGELQQDVGRLGEGVGKNIWDWIIQILIQQRW